MRFIKMVHYYYYFKGRFESNAVWCERSEAALFDTGVRKAAFYVGGLTTTSRGVLEAYSSQKPQFAIGAVVNVKGCTK